MIALYKGRPNSLHIWFNGKYYWHSLANTIQKSFSEAHYYKKEGAFIGPWELSRWLE